MAQVFGLLRRTTRVDFSEYKPPTIGRRMERRMALHKIEKLADYVALLQKDRNEIDALYQDLLINVTSFFRDPEAFEALKRVVYTELLKQRENGHDTDPHLGARMLHRRRTYSHAMALMEFLGEERMEVPIQIFGTDLSETAIQRARPGLYKETIEADVSPVRLRRFFHRVDSGYPDQQDDSRSVHFLDAERIQRSALFAHRPGQLPQCNDLSQPVPAAASDSGLPLRPESRWFPYDWKYRRTAGLGTGTIRLGGQEAEDLSQAFGSDACYLWIFRGNGENHADIPRASRSAKPLEPQRLPVDLQREADRLLLARYAPPSVVVNDQLEIVQTKGHTGPFLELPPGKVSLNLLKMARPGLLFELQNAIDEARKSGVDAVRANVPVDG